MIEILCQKRLCGANGNFTLDTNIKFNSGEFVALYGPSGSGKTTILRMLAGFETPEVGYIKVKDRIFFDSKNGLNLATQKRNIGFLFQDYALFENMSVRQNLLFAKDDKILCEKLLKMCELNGIANSRPSALSGGQKQRAALARALMRKPEILLLDEPLSALDNYMREKLQDYLKALHSEFGMSVVLVSHDVGEIYKLCKKVFIIKDAKANLGLSPNEAFLKHSGSQKLAFSGKILEISQKDSIFIALVLVGQQLCEVALSPLEARDIKAKSEVIISAKGYALSIKPNDLKD